MSLSVLPGRSGFAPVVASLVLAHNGAEVAALPGGLAANRARLALAVPVCVFVEGHPGRVTEADDEALELPVLHGRAFRLRPGGGAPGGLGHAPQPRTFEAPAHRHHFTLRARRRAGRGLSRVPLPLSRFPLSLSSFTCPPLSLSRPLFEWLRPAGLSVGAGDGAEGGPVRRQRG